MTESQAASRPVRWAHHPKPIKAALRQHGIRPIQGPTWAAFYNCQRLFVEAVELQQRLEYHEGTISRNWDPVPHAWLVLNGELKIDLLCDPNGLIYHPAQSQGFPLESVRRTFDLHKGQRAVDKQLTRKLLQKLGDVRPLF